MKRLKNIWMLALIALVAFNCKNNSEPEVIAVDTEVEAAASTLDANATYAKAEFKIEGMTCAMGCANTIQKKIAKMEGVKSAVVDFDKALAMVEYDVAKVTTTSLENTVTSVADIYVVKDMKTVDAFTAKTCSMKCSADCTAKDCAKCAEKTAACKKKCDAKKAAGETKEMACAKDCKKACCAKAEKA